MLFVLIKRRFEWSKYLLVLLIGRSAYRLAYVINDIDANQLTKINVALQLSIAIIAFVILFVIPRLQKLRDAKKNSIEFDFQDRLPEMRVD